jgi:predicted lipoprotein with Yx(FWY)xxD motif
MVLPALLGGLMLRRVLVPALILGLLSGCASPQDTSVPERAAPTTGQVTVTSADDRFGTYLVDGDGRALYLFTLDEPGVSNCDDACLVTWPALLTDGEAAAAGEVDATLLGTLQRDDGTVQVTYAGQPLYTFAGDGAAGEVNGQGINDVWFVIAPDGTALKDAVDDMMDDGMSPSSGGYGY